MSDESRYTVMIHGDEDEEPGPVYTALLEDGQLLVPGVDCPRCEEELMVKGWRSTMVEKSHATYAAVYCVACRRHIGTARYDVPTIFGRKEDLTMLGGRARVYGGGRGGAHGDEAAKQHEGELAVMRAKQERS